MPTFNIFSPRYEKPISCTPASMPTTPRLQSASRWWLSSQRIIPLRCLILRYKCDLTSPCELLPEKPLSGRKTNPPASRACSGRPGRAARSGESWPRQAARARPRSPAGGGTCLQAPEVRVVPLRDLQRMVLGKAFRRPVSWV